MLLLAHALVAILLLERVRRLQRRPLALVRPHALTDVGFLVVGWIALAPLAQVWVAWATQSLHRGSFAFPLDVIAAIVLLDLGNYIAHWLLHRVPALWRIHAVHHSSPSLDALATFRSHVLEQALRRVVAPLLLIAAGLSAATVVAASTFVIAWGIFNHANVRLELRWLEWLFITPRLHHLHHVAASSERNLGTVFSIWDRIAGRFSSTNVPRETLLGNGVAHYPQTFVALLRAPFR